MGNYINDKGYMCFVRSGYSMSHTHGADYAAAELHKREIEDIANEIVNEKINIAMQSVNNALPQAIEDYGRIVWASLIRDLVGVLQTDVNSQVQIAFDGLRDVFYGDKCQKYISDSIMKTLQNEIAKIRYK